MEFAGKKYKMTSSENFDEFMKAIGVGLITRKAANAVTPTVELRKDGDQFTLVTSSTFKTTEMKFKPGEEFDEDRADGVKARVTYNAVMPTVELRKDGDQFTLVTSSTFKTTEMKFKPGEEFDEERADGVKVKTVCSFEGNKLRQVQKSPDGMEVVYDREFGPDQMTAVMKAKDVTCTRVYKAQ